MTNETIKNGTKVMIDRGEYIIGGYKNGWYEARYTGVDFDSSPRFHQGFMNVHRSEIHPLPETK
jgi:hypothetical protein